MKHERDMVPGGADAGGRSLKVIETTLPGVLVVEPNVRRDARGFFIEIFHAERFAKEAGISLSFVQDNHSRSSRGVLRGLHAQRRQPQGKLVRTTRGEVFDVAVDIDPASRTFGKWVGVMLSDSNNRQLWIPPGYAHGFQVLSEVADVEYKCTGYYNAQDEIGVVWNDRGIGIEWPLDDPILSEKDLTLPALMELKR